MIQREQLSTIAHTAAHAFRVPEYVQALVQVGSFASLPDWDRVLVLGYFKLLRYSQRLVATVSGHARVASTPLHSTPALQACVELPYLASALTLVLVVHGLLVPSPGTGHYRGRYGCKVLLVTQLLAFYITLYILTDVWACRQ
jgi:hypothetical protein